jgi:hypothetical protein
VIRCLAGVDMDEIEWLDKVKKNFTFREHSNISDQDAWSWYVREYPNESDTLANSYHSGQITIRDLFDVAHDAYEERVNGR